MSEELYHVQRRGSDESYKGITKGGLVGFPAEEWEHTSLGRIGEIDVDTDELDPRTRKLRRCPVKKSRKEKLISQRTRPTELAEDIEALRAEVAELRSRLEALQKK